MRIPFSPLVAFVLVASPLAAAPLAKPASLDTIARQANIPFDQFTLPNGLRVVVSTDHSVPLVGVSIWYHVGSKDEPAGRTGFAHLFEHLMFYGSENNPDGMLGPLENIGATDQNGTTYFDRTNYFETVPTPALPYTLFLESDRMGHLLGAVTQERLNRQRGVVQNEKRQDDNQPFGLVQYAELEALFPAGHPYHHTTIGSMADIDRASLEDVRAWFRGHYGPNNAVLVLAGDIDVATARTMVTKYFGDLPRGPQPVPTPAAVPTLVAPKVETLHDEVATSRVYREWTTPGLTDPDTVPLDIFASVLGGLASSRFDDILVRKEKLAVSASAQLEPLERVGRFEIQADARPGVDPKLLGKRIDEILADLIAHGPTRDEIERAVTGEVAGRLFALQNVGGQSGRAVTLAEGATYAGDPGFYGKQLAQYAKATPASVTAAARKWLTRPVYALTVSPGPREPYQEAKAAQGGPADASASATTTPASGAPPAAKPTRTAPPVGEIVALNYPPITHAKLSNGIEIVYAQRKTLPLTWATLSFDAGHAADPRDALGTDNLMLELLDQGTTTRSAADIAADQERLGVAIATTASMDRSTIAFAGLSANVVPALDLLADVTLNPSYADIERVRVAELTQIDGEIKDPSGLAARTLPPLIYGGYPYGVPGGGSGDPAVVKRLTKVDLAAFKARWVRPSTAKLFVVSDKPLAELQPLLEARFGTWKGADEPAGTKRFDAPVPAPRPRIVLLDRPGSPQSVIYAGRVLDKTGIDGLVPLVAANDQLGGSFTSRLNLDLRETRAWSYGVQSGVSQYVGRSQWFVVAPVQTDRTGASVRAIVDDMNAYLGARPITEAERTRTVERSIRELPGQFESGSDLIGAMQRNDRLKRPDDFYVHLADRYRALTAADLNAVARANFQPGQLTWVVVGDAAKVRPQLATLGIPIEEAKAPAGAK
ncbi:M16 family metallopeptidase [Sphingomonas sp.]|uniref:M16 family metallopeptidase n=1 Tax=Sphingomonas sp. TaxID=28214 RepID=UPI003B00DA12